METPSHAKFAHKPHRENACLVMGAFESICLTCFQTVATTTNKADRDA